jgi:gliding motility-associated-like protein
MYSRISNFAMVALLTVLSLALRAQQVVTAGPDTSVCTGQTVTLTAVVAGSGPGNSGTVSLSDDQYSGVVPIGFTFTYFGINYTNCIISSNGYVSFNIGNANGYSAWSINNPIPGPGTPLNSIMAPWQDINPSVWTSPNGVISYKTVGTAPNRIFIVEFRDINMFSCTNVCYGGQIQLFETSNIIETHIASKQLCNTWNNGRAIHGIQNATGTIAVAVPGRNFPNQWATVADGRRFTPAGNTYTLSTVPFAPIFIATNIPAIQWTTMGGQLLGTGNTLTVTPSTTTSYLAKLPYSSCGTSFFQDTVTVTVGPMPVTTSPDTAICIGDTAQIWALGTTGQNITYAWSPGATLSGTSIPNPLAFPTQTTAYSVTVSSTLCTATRTINVTVNPLPNVNIAPAAPSICPEADVQLTASGASTYQWSPPTGLSATNIANPIADPAVTSQYVVTGTNANGCVNSDTVLVTVFPAAQVNISPLAPSICLQDSIILTASGAASYLWNPAGMNGLNTGAGLQVSPTQTTTYRAIGTDANGCVDSADVTLIVFALPTANFSVVPPEACIPANLTFTDLSQGNGGIINSWEWFIDSKGGFTQQNPAIVFTAPGVYGAFLKVTTADGCVDSVRIDSAAFARPLPIADFSHTPEKTNIGNPIFFFTDQSSPDVVAWNWTFNGQGGVGASDPSWTFPDVGEYSVQLTVTNQYGCADSTGTMVEVEGISELWIPSAFTPDGDGLNETWFPKGTNLTDNVNLLVLVYDRWGNKVYEGGSPDKPWTGNQPDGQTVCLPGSYSYRIMFLNEMKKYHEFMGKVVLIR